MPMSVVRQRASFIKRTTIQNTLERCKSRKRMSRVEKAIALSSIEWHIIKEPEPPTQKKPKKPQLSTRK